MCTTILPEVFTTHDYGRVLMPLGIGQRPSDQLELSPEIVIETVESTATSFDDGPGGSEVAGRLPIRKGTLNQT